MATASFKNITTVGQENPMQRKKASDFGILNYYYASINLVANYLKLWIALSLTNKIIEAFAHQF